MDYAGLSSTLPQLVHFHCCTGEPARRNTVPCRAMSPALHFGQSPDGVASSAARRLSSSSIREGAARMRFHSSQRSSSARISERTANAVS